MPINAKVPLVRPALTLDKFWIQSLRITANEVGGEANGEVVLVPYNDDGEKDYGRTKIINFYNILSAIAGGDAILAQAFGGIMAAVQAKEDE